MQMMKVEQFAHYFAENCKSQDVFNALIDKGVKFDIDIKKGSSLFATIRPSIPLIRLSINSGNEESTMMILNDGIKVCDVNNFFRSTTAVHDIMKFKNNHEFILEKLIAAGADFSIEERNNKMTPFLYAVFKNNEIAITNLIAARDRDENKIEFDINAKDIDGNTALHLAKLKGNKSMIEKLIAAGADSTKKNLKGKTYLTMDITK